MPLSKSVRWQHQNCLALVLPMQIPGRPYLPSLPNQFRTPKRGGSSRNLHFKRGPQKVLSTENFRTTGLSQACQHLVAQGPHECVGLQPENAFLSAKAWL